jgi:hypothetical protein
VGRWWSFPIMPGVLRSFPALVMMAAYSRSIAAAMIPSRVTGDLLAGMCQLLSQDFGALSRNLLCDNYSSIDQRRRLVAGARELVHGAELFIGGYRWQRSGLGEVAQGGVSAVVVVVVFPVADDDAGLGQRPEASSMFSPSAGMQTVVPFSCSVVMCGLLPCKSGSTGQATTSSDESAPAWASSGEGDVDEARYRDVLGHSSTGVTRLTTLLSRR